MLLDEMEARAQRQLDGMTVNRDAMACDVLDLVAAVRRARSAIADKLHREKPDASMGDFEAAFGSIFRDLFGGRR
ncbi:hypothetical protein ABXN37_29265 [Piscinibacter sakaiensis]|uniref:hypothetical protein n=1 Tax=Piscinibacter sakaiensis TaxID=1547922 RepID=UPI00372967A0